MNEIFSDRNATDSSSKIGPNISDFNNINFNVATQNNFIENDMELFVEPSIQSQILGTIMAGTTGEIIQTDDMSKNWIEIELIGYIPVQFIEQGN